MCGIAGLIAPLEGEKLAGLVGKMGLKQVHRGPDSNGIWVDAAQGVALGHQRLAIVDLSANGHQPMASNDGRYQLVFNGEIYNFQMLRKLLQAKGHSFRGDSDTEVILAGVQEWGAEPALRKMEGMFAFALWDSAENCLLLARDRMGEKPLYYGWLDEKFVFSSELGAIEALGVKLKIDRNALASYFHYGYVPAPACIYENIYKLLPGTCVSFCVENRELGKKDFNPFPSDTQISPYRYWNLDQVAEFGLKNPLTNPDEAVNDLDDLLIKVVSQQIITDVPIGAFISGGVDSSTVAAIMQHVSDRPIDTFTIGFNEPQYNEAGFAKSIAKHLGTSHNELYIGEQDCLDVAPALSSIYDEPIADSSQIPTYLVSRMARQKVTVCLSGDGGDELFAGYNRYIATDKFWKKSAKLPSAVRKAAAILLGSLPPSLYNSVYLAIHAVFGSADTRQNNVGLKVQKIAKLLQCNDLLGAYKLLIFYWQSTEQPLRQSNSLTQTALDRSPPNALETFIDKAMYWDQMTYLPGDNLVKVDRASMAVSLETRLPLLHHEVVEFAWRVPLAMKVRENTSKWLLRQVLYRYVPRELIERPKMGFSVPVAAWLRGPLREWAEALLADLNDSYFDDKLIEQHWRQHQSGKYDYGHQLWGLFMFLDWAKVRSVSF